MLRTLVLLSFFLFSGLANAQFLLPKFQEAVKVKSLSSEAEESFPFFFNGGTEIYFHRTYFEESGDEFDVLGKDIWYTDLDLKASKKVDENQLYKKVWKRPYRLFRDGEVEGINEVIGSSEDGQVIYLLNTIFVEDTFTRRVVSLKRKGNNSWENSYDELTIPGLVFDGRNIELRMNQSADVLLISMSSTPNDENEDIYVSLKKGENRWSELIHLGENVNSSRPEITPFLSKDKKTLYFSSYGHEGYGSADVFMSKRLDDSWKKWTRPLNLGEPINSKDFEAYFVILDSSEVYFASDREATFENFYAGVSTGEYQMANTEKMNGQFFFQQLPLSETKLEIYDTDGNLIDIVETDGQGKFSYLKLKEDENYMIKLAAEDQSEFLGGKIYLNNEDGSTEERFFLTENGYFKASDEITDREKVQGVYMLDQSPQDQKALLLEDENSYILDTVYTNELGKFHYYKVKYDEHLTLTPLGLNAEELKLVDLYLTDENGNRTEDLMVREKSSGSGKFVYNKLPIENSVIKVFDANGDLVEVIVTNDKGEFSYKKLNLEDDLTFKLEDADDTELIGGILYVQDDKTKTTKRFFVDANNNILDPEKYGTETVYGQFNYKNLPAQQAALVIYDANGIAIDTILTDDEGAFKYEKLMLDNNYSIKPIDATDDDTELYLTDAQGNKTQSPTQLSDGTYGFKSQKDLAVLDQDRPALANVEKMVYFDFNSIKLTKKAQDNIKELIKEANKRGIKQFKLIGHADEVGTKEVNYEVGLMRAWAVRYYMRQFGYSINDIEVHSEGQDAPIAPNNTAENRAKNRRVEVIFK